MDLKEIKRQLRDRLPLSFRTPEEMTPASITQCIPKLLADLPRDVRKGLTNDDIGRLASEL
ncbi:unnamed protein product, partial [marine sediment metagenome]